MPVKKSAARSTPPASSGAGYSGTPLAKKLSLKDGMRVWARGMPATVRREIDAAGPGVTWLRSPEPGLPAAHLFVTDRHDLASSLAQLRGLIDQAGFVWISWPKKASGMPTNITEDTIRDIALPEGWVDIKVCAVDATWSGLKLVIRKDLRR